MIASLSYKICVLALTMLSCTPAHKPGAVLKVLSGYDKSSKGQPVTIVTTGKVTPAQLIAYAQTLKGITYKYGSTDPNIGFDCSGFITFVFNHFGVTVPRSSVDFTNVQHEIPVKDAKPGDLILYTGTDSTKKVVGHMGIIETNNHGDITFIHSTSGKANGVTETPLNTYYQGRYMKTIRIFPENDATITH